LGNEDNKKEVEKIKMKAVEVELNQEKSITEEMKRKVEAEKRDTQRKRGREEDDKEEEEVKKKEKVEEEDLGSQPGSRGLQGHSIPLQPP